MNASRIAAGIAAAAIAAVTATACGSAYPAATGRHATSHRPSPAAAATYSPAPPAPSTPPASLHAASLAWLGGPGGQHMLDVRHDLNRMTADATAGRVAADASDGMALAADASAAATTPPPVGSAPYVRAMLHFVQAGNDAAAGNYTGASAALNRGASDLGDVSAALKAQL